MTSEEHEAVIAIDRSRRIVRSLAKKLNERGVDAGDVGIAILLEGIEVIRHTLNGNLSESIEYCRCFLDGLEGQELSRIPPPVLQ